jgi:hypothetical protein
MKYIKNEYVLNPDNNGIICLICWEEKNKQDTIEKLKNILPEHYDCECNGYFHISCITKWIKMYMSCPICRIRIQSIIVVRTKKCHFLYNFSFYINFIHCLLKTLYFLWVLLFIYHVSTYFY